MTMKAKVILKEGLSHTRGGRTFKKGFPQILSGSAEILYYQSQSSFSVTITEGESQAAELPKSGAGDPDAPDLVIYSKDKLKGMKKKDLLAVADTLEVLLTGEEKKGYMVAQILEAQEALTEDDDEDGGS